MHLLLFQIYIIVLFFKCIEIMSLCIFCDKTQTCKKIHEKICKFGNEQIEATVCLQIFAPHLIAEILKNTDANICNCCLKQLENAYAFIQQTLKAKICLKTTTTATVNARKLRPLLPKPKISTNETKGCASQIVTTHILNKKSACRVYKCRECPEAFNSYRLLKSHENAAHPNGNSNFSICDLCCSLHQNDETLKKHKFTAHANKKYSCFPCIKHYKSKGALLKHVNKSHQGNELFYYCAVCTNVKQFSSRTKLEEHAVVDHLSMTSSTKNEKADADADDDVEFVMNEEFLDDFLLSNTNENSFHFSECWDALDLNFHDMLHMQNTNNENHNTVAMTINGSSSTVTNLYAYKCPKCFENFNNQKLLLLHLATKHQLNVLICNKCDACFSDLNELRRHKALHVQRNKIKKNDDFQCGICDKIFKTNATLNYHIKTHARTMQISHECPYCGKSFSGESNIKQHLRTVHAQLKRHTCQLCDRQFATLDHLKKHVLSQHQNERKYICHVCAKRFTQLCHLKQHITIHTVGKSYQCKICDVKFWRKIDVERHMATKHTQESIMEKNS